MIIELHPQNPEKRKLNQISESLKEGGVFIFPTDTVYALIADSQSKMGVEKLYDLKNIPKNKPLSILCPDISTASQFIEFLPNDGFKLMKRLTPGPYVFIVRANKNLPRVSFTNQKSKQVGIRIPDHIYLKSLLEIHGGTLTSTSVFSEDEYITEIEDLEQMYGHQVDGIIDGGIVKVELSTILDFTGDEIEVVREGKGLDKI